MLICYFPVKVYNVSGINQHERLIFMDNRHNGKRAFDLTLHIWLHHTLVFLKWLLWAAVIGIALGFISTAFHYSVDFAQELRLK